MRLSVDRVGQNPLRVVWGGRVAKPPFCSRFRMTSSSWRSEMLGLSGGARRIASVRSGLRVGSTAAALAAFVRQAERMVSRTPRTHVTSERPNFIRGGVYHLALVERLQAVRVLLPTRTAASLGGRRDGVHRPLRSEMCLAILPRDGCEA